jgi:plastocyanin
MLRTPARSPLAPVAFVLASLVACGGDGDDSTDRVDEPDIDASVEIDAAPGAVVEVSCPPAADAEVITNAGGDAFVPSATTISVGQIVHFDLGAAHNALGDGWTVGFGGDECLQFNEVGTYGFECTPHGFTGTIEVQ